MLAHYERHVTMVCSDGECPPVNRTLHEGTQIVFTNLICLSCQVNFSIEADFLFKLRAENVRLYAMLVEALERLAVRAEAPAGKVN